MVLRPPSKDALNPATPGKSKFGLKLERDHHASDIEFGVKASIGFSRPHNAALFPHGAPWVERRSTAARKSPFRYCREPRFAVVAPRHAVLLLTVRGDQVGVMQSRWQREYPSFLPIEAKPLPPAFMRAEPHPEPEPRNRVAWIVVGVVAVFGFASVGTYWYLHRGQQPAMIAAAPPPAAPAKPAPAAPKPAPAEPSPQAATPQLAVGLPALSRPAPPPAPVASQPAAEPSEPAQLTSGLKPIAAPPPAPVPVAEAPPPPPMRVEPRRPPQPRPAVNRLPPSDNPASSGFVRF